jgi:integrase
MVEWAFAERRAHPGRAGAFTIPNHRRVRRLEMRHRDTVGADVRCPGGGCMARGSSGARGVFFVPDPDGSQRLSGGVRGDWWVHYYCKSDACPQGRRHREKVGSRALACEVYGRRKARVRAEGWCPRVERRERARQQLSLNDLIDLVEKDYIHNGRKALPRIAEYREHLTTFFGASRVPRTLEGSDIAEYKRHRRAEGAAVATINRELCCLRRGYNLAREQGMQKLSEGPVIRTDPERNVREGFIEDVVHRALVTAIEPVYRPICEFLYCTGWREANALDLRWKKVDESRGIVRAPYGTTKNAKPIEYPFSDNPDLARVLRAQKELQRAPEMRGKIVPWVFHRGGKPIGKLTFCRAFKRAAGRIGHPDLRPHDYRRGAARDLVEGGAPERWAMEVTGHKTRSVFDRYNIVDSRQVAEAVRRLVAQRQRHRAKAAPARTSAR